MEIKKQPEIERFISKFCNLTKKHNSISRHNQRILPSVLREIIYIELPKRDNERELMVRDLYNANSIDLFFNSDDITFIMNQEKQLSVAVLTPFWSKGLTARCKEEDVYNEVSWFMHFSQQYIARSRFVELIGAIALTYKRATHFMSSSLQTFQISDFGYNLDSAKIKAFGLENLKKDWSVSSMRQRETFVWLGLINGLDPFIHRLLFNYTRAVQLGAAYFDEEAIVSLDKTINVAEQFLRHRLKCYSPDQRNLLATILSLNKDERDMISKIYKIRCYFGAHPAGSKWWDFGEMYGEDLPYMFDVTKHLIYKLLLLERDNRVVNKHPNLWSEWFCRNIDMLYKTIWFSEIPGD